MLKQQTVSTSLGELTVSALTLGDIRNLPDLFIPMAEATDKLSASFDRFLPAIVASLRKVHQDITIQKLEDGLTLQDFNALVAAMMKVGGVESSSGEARAAEMLV